MTQYFCKFQKLVSQGQYWAGCMNCTADVINNIKCPNYAPIDFSCLKVFTAINKLEEKVK